MQMRGIVWERSPATTPIDWYDAVSTCWQHVPAIEKAGIFKRLKSCRVWLIRRLHLQGQNCRVDIHSRTSRTAALRPNTGRQRRVFAATLARVALGFAGAYAVAPMRTSTNEAPSTVGRWISAGSLCTTRPHVWHPSATGGANIREFGGRGVLVYPCHNQSL